MERHKTFSEIKKLIFAAIAAILYVVVAIVSQSVLVVIFGILIVMIRIKMYTINFIIGECMGVPTDHTFADNIPIWLISTFVLTIITGVIIGKMNFRVIPTIGLCVAIAIPSSYISLEMEYIQEYYFFWIIGYTCCAIAGVFLSKTQRKEVP